MSSMSNGTAGPSGQRSPSSHQLHNRPAGAAGRPGATRVDELTIAQIHSAMKAGRLTCRGLVDAYLRRIDAYDKQGPRSTPSW